MQRIVIILLLSLGFITAKEAVEIKVNQPGLLIMELSIDTTWISSTSRTIYTYPNLDAYFNPGLPIIPYYKEILIGIPANAYVQIFTDNKELVGNYNPIISDSEKSKGLDLELELPIESKFDGYFPKQKVKLSPIADVDGIRSSKIEVFPVSIQDGQLFVTKNISVQIKWDARGNDLRTKMLSKTSLEKLRSTKTLKKPSENIIPEYQFSNNIAKIVVNQSGWYKISNSELNTFGINLDGINRNTLQLWNHDDEIPLLIDDISDGIFNSEDIIIFYGEINPSPPGSDYDYNFYTNDNVYWLTWGSGNGLRFEEKDVSLILPDSLVNIPTSFIDTIKVEKEERYFRLKYNNEFLGQTWDVTDHIFMAASFVPGSVKNINISIPDPLISENDSFKIELLLYGVTYRKHDVNVKLNDIELFDVSWLGQSKYSANNYEQQLLTSDILKHGNNTLSLLASKDDPAAHDRIEMNWIKLVYPRYYRAYNDYLNFQSDNNNNSMNQFTIQNLLSDEILLFKDKNQILNNASIDYIAQDNTYAVSFQDNNSDSKYEIISKEKLLNVSAISFEQPIHYQLSNIQNDYIAICPDSFISALEPLIEARNGITIDIEDIYRQYNGGVLSPYAIKAFLSENFNNNEGKLKYVLIAMQNNLYDQCCLQSTNQRDSFIPSMHIFVYEWGDLVSDYWYSLLDGNDIFPEISVGRFPATNIVELEEMVEKTMYHINRTPQIWDNNTLLIGGRESVFKYQSEYLANNFIKNGQFLSRIYVAEDTLSNFYYSNTDTLLSHFNRGLSYVNFLGHGGAYVWSDAQLLNRDAISNEIIRNGKKLPFISSMTCYTGDISRPNSLGRYMLTNPYGGALAWYGSAGPGWSINDFYMVDPLQPLLFSTEDLSIGESINRSKFEYYATYSNIYPYISESQLYQFNLIGDPAIKLKKPTRDVVDISPLDPEPGEDLEISSNNSQSDSVFYQLFLPNNYSLNQSTSLGNSLSDNISLPDTLKKGMHNINISYKSNNELYNSSQIISVTGSYVKILSTIPSTPTICDSIGVIAEVSDRNGVSKINLLWNNEYWSDMTNSDSNHYSSEKLIPPQPTGTILNLICQVIDTNNDTTNSLPTTIKISDIPNIVPLKGEFSVDDAINLIVDIESTTTTPVNANVELFINENDNWQLIGKDTVDFIGMEIKEAIFPSYYRFGMNQYKVVTNANLTCMSTNLITDDTLTFNLETNAFWITPEHGSTDNGTSHSKIGINNIEIDIPSGLVNESSIIQILPLSDVMIPSQPDFEIVQSLQKYNGLDIIWDTSNDYEINWTIGEPAVQSKDKLYRYFENYRNWLPINHIEVSDSTINFPSNGSAKFAFLNSTDIEKPTIVATLNEQQFLKNNYLTTSPSIQFTIYDKNGIDHRADSIYYWINNSIIDVPAEYSGSGNSINVIINPIFTEFDSTLAILVQDAAGNQSDTLELSFIISEKLDLIDYGNYPNPFVESTVFAYELTDAVEKFTFTIYTIEGRKIRRLENDNIISGANINLPGYHEIGWDGKNQDGVQVGNGNYFYQIRAKNNKTVLERSGKILKVK